MQNDLSKQLPNIIRLNFIDYQELSAQIYEDIQLLYVIQGTMDVQINNQNYRLYQEDMIMINNNETYKITGTKGLFIGQFIISYAKLSEQVNQNLIYFSCNSVRDKNEVFKAIRTIINHIFVQQVQPELQSLIYLNSLYFQLLHFLTSNFLLTERDIRFEFEKNEMDSRMQELLHYLRTHYFERINLQELADKFFLSSAYLSKYIKMQSNLTFLDLLTEIRLNHAVDDLRHTEDSIMKIAMKNGFASVSAFNKSFKDKYQTTPSEFQNTIVHPINREKSDQEHYQVVKTEKLHTYLKNKPIKNVDHQDENISEIHVNTGLMTMSEPLHTNFKLINIGRAIDMQKSRFKKHLLLLKKQVGFKYVRFWDLFGPDMSLSAYRSDQNYNFVVLDDILDFLVENQLTPYIELGFKPIRILETTQVALKDFQPTEFFKNAEEMEAFFFAFTRHLYDRYGSKEIETWYFEFWKREDIKFVDSIFNYSPIDVRKSYIYLEKFCAIAKGMRRGCPNLKIGGGGFSVQHYGKDKLVALFNDWNNYDQLPDFITINCFPYQIETNGTVYFEKKTTDMYFIAHNIEIVKEAIRISDFPVIPLHVSEYNLTLSNRNAINDSCQKAAFLLQSLISTTNTNEMIGYWLGSDAYSDLEDSSALLFGGCGLVTKNGLMKPSAFAYRFMNQLYENVLKKEKNYIITGNYQQSWKIACHNFKNFSYNYYLTEENAIKYENIQYMVEDNSVLRLKFHFEMLEPGTYKVKRQILNNRYGNLQRSVFELPNTSDVDQDEYNYLTSKSSPKLVTEIYPIDNTTLSFEIFMLPNELQLIEISFIPL